MIRHVYLPLMENRHEIRLHMEKFQKQINISLQQAYGTVTIRVPLVPANKDETDIKKDKKLIEEFQVAIVSLQTIARALKALMTVRNSRVNDLKNLNSKVYWRQFFYSLFELNKITLVFLGWMGLNH